MLRIIKCYFIFVGPKYLFLVEMIRRSTKSNKIGNEMKKKLQRNSISLYFDYSSIHRLKYVIGPITLSVCLQLISHHYCLIMIWPPPSEFGNNLYYRIFYIALIFIHRFFHVFFLSYFFSISHSIFSHWLKSHIALTSSTSSSSSISWDFFSSHSFTNIPIQFLSIFSPIAIVYCMLVVCIFFFLSLFFGHGRLYR